MLTVLAMTLGELNYVDVFVENNNNPFKVDSYILVGIFMLMMPIALVNLLVSTVKFLNIRTPENFAVIYLKIKQRGQALGYFVKKTQMEEQSDQGLHYFRTYLSENLGSLRSMILKFWTARLDKQCRSRSDCSL